MDYDIKLFTLHKNSNRQTLQMNCIQNRLRSLHNCVHFTYNLINNFGSPVCLMFNEKKNKHCNLEIVNVI